MISSSVRAMSMMTNQTVSSRKDIQIESKNDDFSKMMNESINKAKKTDINDESKYDNKIKDSSKIQDEDSDEKVVEKTEDVSEVEKTDIDETVEEEPVSEEISEEIINAVALVLNVSVEELQETLDKSGIEGKDLLDVENVTKLVMDLNNIENKLELLVHDNANDAIKDVQKAIEELMENISEEPENDMVNGLQGEHISEISQETNAQTEFNESSDDSNHDNNLSKDEKVENTLNNPVNDVKTDILNEIETALDERVDETVATRIIREIADNISLAVRDKMTSLEMQLNPESLGKVTILLATEESGITAKITAETEATKNVIEQQLTILKENFEKQGLKVTDVEVTIASHEFEQNLDKNNGKDEGQQQKKHNGIRKGLLDEINGISTEEEVKEDIMKEALGNTISYLA